MDNHNSIIHGLFLIYICVNVWFSTTRSEHIYTHLSKNEFILETFDKSAPKLFPSTPYIKARSVCPQCCTCCVRFASRGFIHIFNRLRRCFAPPPPFFSPPPSLRRIQSLSLGRSIIHHTPAEIGKLAWPIKTDNFRSRGSSTSRSIAWCSPMQRRYISYLRTPWYFYFVRGLPSSRLDKYFVNLADNSCFSSSSSSKYNVEWILDESVGYNMN